MSTVMFFLSILQICIKPVNTALSQPHRGTQGWGGLIHRGPAAVEANGTTMLPVFVEWLTALVGHKSVLSYDTVDNEVFSQHYTKLKTKKVLHVL